MSNVVMINIPILGYMPLQIVSPLTMYIERLILNRRTGGFIWISNI